MAAVREQVSDFEELAQLARSGDASGLPDAALRAQCDLFVRHGAEGHARDAFVALALTLIPRVAPATLRLVAGKLAADPATPPEILEALYAMGGAVAADVLARAPRLPPLLKSGAVAAADPRLASALATRADLADAEQAALAMRTEPAVRRSLASGAGVLPHAVAATLIDAARGDDVLAGLLLDRPGLDPAALLPLYRFASPAQRRNVRDLLGRRITERGLTLPDQRASASDTATLLDVSIRGLAPFAAAVARVSRRDGAFEAAALQDDSREILTLALRALDIAPEDGIRMMLRTGDAVARDTVALGHLVDLLRHSPRAVATAILAAGWPRGTELNQARAAHTAHQPVMTDGGTPSRAPAVAARPRQPVPRVLEQLRGKT